MMLKTKPPTIFRAKVTGRHAITLPAELCRQLGIEVGDFVQIELGGDTAVLRPVEELPITAIRGIMKTYFPDTASNQAFLQEERSGWDEREVLYDKIREGAWQSEEPSAD
jgi:bifunctional DNA-binding transcriptional regulator/antitoxin component of YhaV-PrlF toxin-antitoxin module